MLPRRWIAVIDCFYQSSDLNGDYCTVRLYSRLRPPCLRGFYGQAPAAGTSHPCYYTTACTEAPRPMA